jgi:hypothetical protein
MKLFTNAADIIDKCYKVFNLKHVCQLMTEPERGFSSSFLGDYVTYVNYLLTLRMHGLFNSREDFVTI